VSDRWSVRRLVIVCSLAAVLVAAVLVPQFLAEQHRQRVIEFVKNYKGTHNSGASVQDLISIVDVGCACGSSGQVLQSWRAEPGDRVDVWRVTCNVKTPLRTIEIRFYTDMVTVWPGDEEAGRILNEVNAERTSAISTLVMQMYAGDKRTMFVQSAPT
jgi:hypothetical protein